MRKFLLGLVGAIVATIIVAPSLGQPGTTTKLRVSDITLLQQSVTALTARVSALESQLTTAQTKLTAAENRVLILEKLDRVVITKFLGPKNVDGSYPSAELTIQDVDGSAANDGVVSTAIPQGVTLAKQ